MSGFFKDIGDKFKSIFTQQEKRYFLNSTNINSFSESMMRDLAYFKIIKELLKKTGISHRGIDDREYEAFNLLINQIELEKGNSRVEVGVIGSFSSGKSTFINSLFGEEICPMAVRPTTSSITKFYYGYKEKITVNGKEITRDEYYSYAQHKKKDIQNSKTYYIEYAYPFERLNSIVLYDTPGFNNNLNSNDTEVTMKTLQSVDVIFFLIDISKGAIDMSSIERIDGLRDKRVYCILNKSDLKSAWAIEKIKKEIVSKKIFLEVIEYSASKVLKFGEIDYLRDHFNHIQEELIPKKISFTTTLGAVAREKKGRLKSKIEYRLYIDSDEYDINDFYISAKEQKRRVEKMLNRLLGSKQFTLKQKLKRDIYRYHKNSISTLEDILYRVKAIKSWRRDRKSIAKLKDEINSFIREKQEYVTRL